LKSRLHVFAALAVAATITFVIASAVNAASNPGNGKPHAVLTASDNGKSKLDAKLQDALESSSTATVPVFVTATDGVPAIEALLTDAHAATRAGNAIVIGKINVQQLPKLGSIDGVVSVGSVDFEQTGEPLGVDPDINKQPSLSTLQSTANTLRKQEVSYANAPALKGSNFEALKNLNVLDAKTHRFADAWKAGFDGAGTVGSVLDGGTDWGHPDLIGTWKTWTNAPDPGWNGWPMAFDPFGTLQLLLAPGQIDQGLSWYTKTQAQTSFGSVASNASLATVSFATRTGPSRNFSAPDGKNTHTYSFPKAWAAGGKVWLGSHPDDHLLQLFGERPAYLLVDSNKDGQGDTLYVDLDDDYQFGDEKPVTKGSPVSYRDMNGDGYVDLSGGLAYFIADGTTTVPGGQLDFGGEIVPDANSLVAWTGDFDPAIEGHGTLTASNVVGQGVINGKAPTFSDLPGDGKYPGAVIGGAPKARLAPMGDIYFSFDFSTQFGYLLTAGYGVDVTSNSYGNSDNDNDGYDAASQEAGFLNAVLNGGRTTPVFSTGNGAPGYGTATAPRPFNGISVGASTQFGGTGWDSVAKLANIPDNDVVLWSNRGPGAPGSTGVDVVADGAYSPGDATLNSVLDGRNAWETWGGTSRSTPVTVGATLLAYQAFAQANGGAKPTNAQARRIIKSSAQDLRYDAWTQGAGSVDAKRATEIATSGGTVSPDAWRAGSYRGVSTYPTFTNLVAPGGSSSRSFSVTGSGTYSVSDRYLVRSAHVTKSFTSSDVNNESESNFNAPDYLMNITSEVQAHSDADLMVVRANFPYDKFDGNGDYVPDQKWRLLTYKWNDVNGDGRLWQDTDGNGAVRHPAIATNSSIDAGFADVNYNAAEIEKGEYVRFQYHRPDANTLISFVRQPAQRMADGLFLGFQHNVRSKAIPTTSFDIEIDFYKQVDWPWLSTPATVNAPGTFSATLNVPGDAAYGMYEGAIVLTKNGRDQVVPVSATVGATLPQDAAGNVTGTLDFGGASVANAQAGQLYNNGAVFGATDWSWRAESGDWRFFYYDALKAPPAGTLLLADTSWADGVPTDIDTLLFGRSANSYQLVGGSGSLIGDPYILDTIGKSPNTNTGAGIWKFNTATGGSRDIVSGPAQEGLGAVAWHQVNFKGDQFYTPVKTTLGAAQVAPSAVAQTTSADTGSFDVTFKANVDLTGLKSEAFGLSQPTTENVQVKQDNPDVSSTASVKRNITLHHASKLQVNFDLATDDNDLFVLRDANGDGQFTSNEIVASSTSGSSHEAVTLVKPADGAYQIWVHGFSVAGTPTGALKIDAIQGDDLTVTGVPAGAVPAGTLVTLHVAYSKAMTAGQYFGELLLGPNEAPAALRVPITVTRS
jgi:hypothetical protein